jgi:hypothetical protein
MTGDDYLDNRDPDWIFVAEAIAWICNARKVHRGVAAQLLIDACSAGVRTREQSVIDPSPLPPQFLPPPGVALTLTPSRARFGRAARTRAAPSSNGADVGGLGPTSLKLLQTTFAHISASRARVGARRRLTKR